MEPAEKKAKGGVGAFESNERAQDAAQVRVLKALRAAWKSLALEEQQGYALRAAEDQERFRAELQVPCLEAPSVRPSLLVRLGAMTPPTRTSWSRPT